ncbi:hypothetical protein NDU88_006493 [Pleurodeles waltl]|uniref:Uncharacterized protein n=1 Tax=Pleurodeles waltl TaxID=8319 RepID=A0AAV7X0W6_PLEWA|nr:hypothetical protein NDU88_006493 [Pleurodeles waltl]
MTEEPSRVELLAAIQGPMEAPEGKIEMVAVEVNLLRVDLRKVSEKVMVAEGSIVELQTEVGALCKQMVQVNSMVGRLEARLEDAEARESERAVFENCKISIYPDYTNKVQTPRKGFMELKAKLRAMNVTYMLLYLACLKVLSGRKSHFFDRPEKVWRCRTKLLLAGRRGPAVVTPGLVDGSVGTMDQGAEMFPVDT